MRSCPCWLTAFAGSKAKLKRFMFNLRRCQLGREQVLMDSDTWGHLQSPHTFFSMLAVDHFLKTEQAVNFRG